MKIIPEQQAEINPNARKIIFSHRRALGDAIMFSAGVRDFHLLFPSIEINVDSNQSAVFKHNPYINQSLTRTGENIEFYRVGYPAVGYCNATNIHFTQMFLLDMIAVADHHHPLPISLGEFCAAFANGESGDPCLGNPTKNPDAREPFISLKKKYAGFCNDFSRQRGDIHLSEEEKSYNLIKEVYGIDKYWVVAPGGKRDVTTKIWDWRKFQDVIDHFDGYIQFVVIGKSDLLVENLKKVIDLTDKFNEDSRGLFPLVYHAEGCVSGPSALMHIAAAVPPRNDKARKPCVTIFGGREPISWSFYTNQQILHRNGVYSCCSSGGCWTARTYPLPKDPKHNKNLCKKSIDDNGRTIPACMASITSSDVIRAIEIYYEGDLYSLNKPMKQEDITMDICVGHKIIPIYKESKSPESQKPKIINLLGNLHTKGGGEQSLLTLAKVFKDTGWDVRLFPFQGVHDDFKSFPIVQETVQECDFLNMHEYMEEGTPVLYYANDTVRQFAESSQKIVEKASSIIIGINYINTPLPKCDWLSKSGKVAAVIFQNEEKMNEWKRDQLGYQNTKLISLYGAIELDTFLEVCTKPRKDKNDKLIVLKHCTPDWRKYVTKNAEGKGEKVHLWQKCIAKENDIKFYTRLLKDINGDIEFWFMQAPDELVNEFRGFPSIKFFRWNQIPVTEFLASGHIYLYRTSNLWRDQYPRVVAEALAAGLPVLTEPRDGTKDRVIHGDTGFYCVDYDGFLYALKLLRRKEDYRQKMGRACKDWSRVNLDPRKWVDIIEGVMK